MVPRARATWSARHQGRPADPVAAVRRRSPRASRGSRTRSTTSPAQVQLGSPKQLGEFLFGKLGLPGGKQDQDRRMGTARKRARRSRRQRGAARACTQAASTHARMAAAHQAEVDLYRLAAAATSIPRPAASTPAMRSASTTTGRLSSIRAEPAEHPDPHQGRPRDPHGLHRRAGHKLISADYSQIELRVLAHIADIPQLQQGLRRRPRHPRHDGVRDVRRAGRRHAAARCAGAPRRSISASSTASRRSAWPHQLGIAAQEAGEYIKHLFQALPRHPRLHGRDTKRCARERRLCRDDVRPAHPLSRRSTPRTRPMRGFLERAAINAPIQGSAADIIRRAMIRMPGALGRRRGFGAHAAAGARRTGLRGARRGGGGDDAGRDARVMERRRRAGGRSSRVPLQGRCARRATIGTRRIDALSGRS